MIFPVFLIIGFSLIYVFGPAVTGFHSYGGSELSNNFSLVFILMLVFIFVFVGFKEIMARLG